MRFNQDALKILATKPGEKEGSLLYKAPREGYKSRLIKLKSNLLFIFRANDRGMILENEPVAVLVLEAFTVKMELPDENPFVLSLCFGGDSSRKHYFAGKSEKHCQEWILAMQDISHVNLKEELDFLRSQVKLKTGQDPVDVNLAKAMKARIVQPTPKSNSNSTFHVMTRPTLIQQNIATTKPRPATYNHPQVNSSQQVTSSSEDILIPDLSRPTSFPDLNRTVSNNKQHKSSIFHVPVVSSPVQSVVNKVQQVMNRQEVGASAFYDTSTTDVKTKFKDWETFD